MRSLRVNFTLIALGLVWALPSVLAHGEDIHNGTTQVEMTMGHSQGHGSHDGSSRPMMMKDMEDFPSHPTYFMHEEHGGLMYAHIGIMLLAWVIAMPLSKSRRPSSLKYSLTPYESRHAQHRPFSFHLRFRGSLLDPQYSWLHREPRIPSAGTRSLRKQRSS